MKIQILGTGCTKCKKLAELAQSVATDLKIDYEIEKITDINEIMKLGVMITPALAIENQVKFSGKIPSAEQMKRALIEFDYKQ